MKKGGKISIKRFMVPIVIFVLIIIGTILNVSADNGNLIVIDEDILSNNTNFVAVVDNNNNEQKGYATLEAAMEGIGNGTSDYSIVFLQDYVMQPTADQTAMTNNGKNAASFYISSRYVSETDKKTQIDCTVSVPANSTNRCNFTFNAATTIDYCDFEFVSTTVHMFGCGHDFTIGEHVTTSGFVQLYGGGASDLVSDTNLTVNSGDFSIVMAGNFRGSLKGDAKVTIQGTATVTKVYAGSQTVGFTGDSSGTINIDGSKGASIKSLISPSYVSNGFTENDNLTINIKNLMNAPLGPLTTNSAAPSTVNISGNCHIPAQIIATNLSINDNASLRLGSNGDGSNGGISGNYRGILTLTGDLKLGDNSSFVHAGSGAKTVGGDLVVGNNASLELFKVASTSTTANMAINGKYKNINNKLSLSYYKDAKAEDGDILLTYSSTDNANQDNYKDNNWISDNAAFAIIDDGVNICLDKKYDIPTYYIPVDGKDNLYYYIEVGTKSISDGLNHKVYRLLDTTENKWYPCDKNGNRTSTTEVDQERECPQPNIDAKVDYNLATATMVRLDHTGRFRITAAVGTNATGLTGSNTGTASGIPTTTVNIDGKGKENGSWANLKRTNDTCSIYKAYLVMTTTCEKKSTDETKDQLLNKPMTLMAPSGAKMQSNGYLPKGFVIGTEGVNSENLNSHVPTLLMDAANNPVFNNALGEAMTITDVTDFVKKEGYGKYYGLDIPTAGTDPDGAIAWRLIVIEEDTSMNYMRKISLQMGPITNGNSSDYTELKVGLGQFTTPDSGDFGGQVLIIGSDNTFSLKVGGKTDSNIGMLFYPDYDKKDEIAIDIGSNDPNTGVIDRPEGHWSQGLMDIDGKRLAATEISHITDAGAMGIDMALLNVTNEKTEDWETNGGTNLYLTHKSGAVGIASKYYSSTAIGYVDTVALSVDIAAPTFETSITHERVNEEIDDKIIAGESVLIHGHAINNTQEGSVQGSFNTKVVVTVDNKLTNIRGVDDSDTITATFHDYDPSTGKTVDRQVIGVYDKDSHTITFDFGSKNPDYNEYDLYNSADDSIDIDFKADTANINEGSDYDNKISVEGHFILRDNVVVETPATVYAYGDDAFETIKNRIVISKSVGADIDKSKKFDFIATFKDEDGNNLAKGTAIKYTGGVLDNTDATAPENGTIVVGDNGQVEFKLSHGQMIVIEDIDASTVEIEELNSSDYSVKWSPTDEKADEQGADKGSTGSTKIKNNETTYFSFYNDSKPIDKGSLKISKEVVGEKGDTNKEFKFTAILKDKDGNLFDEGTQLEYTGFVVDGASATAPEGGTLTVNAKGEVNFQLKHGQGIDIKDILVGNAKVTESSYADYDTSWSNGISNQNGNVANSQITKDETSNIEFTNKYNVEDPVIDDGTPKVEVNKTPDKNTVAAGDMITYSITVKNKGDGVAKGVIIQDYVPKDTTFVRINDNIGKYGARDQKEYVTWFILQLKPNESKTVSFTVKVDECVGKDNTIKNTAMYKVTGSKDEPYNVDLYDGDKTSNDTTVKIQTTQMIKTGDTMMIELYIVLLVSAALLVIVLLIMRKKRNANKK